MSINVGDGKNIPPDEEACREEVASQEELYLETTEERTTRGFDLRISHG